MERPSVLFYFGDDVGDEPAFAVVSQGGSAVRVGKRVRSFSRAFLPNQSG